MKLKVVWGKVYDYVRYDLKEIAFPSSLPDPPHIKKRRKLTWKERYLVSIRFILNQVLAAIYALCKFRNFMWLISGAVLVYMIILHLSIYIPCMTVNHGIVVV